MALCKREYEHWRKYKVLTPQPRPKACENPAYRKPVAFPKTGRAFLALLDGGPPPLPTGPSHSGHPGKMAFAWLDDYLTLQCTTPSIPCLWTTCRCGYSHLFTSLRPFDEGSDTSTLLRRVQRASAVCSSHRANRPSAASYPSTSTFCSSTPFTPSICRDAPRLTHPMYQTCL